MLFLIILCTLLLPLCVFLSFVAVRFSKRLLQFDEMFSYLNDDVNSNLKHLEETLAKPLFLDTPEVVEMNRKFSIMKKRMEEYALRISENRGLKK